MTRARPRIPGRHERVEHVRGLLRDRLAAREAAALAALAEDPWTWDDRAAWWQRQLLEAVTRHAADNGWHTVDDAYTDRLMTAVHAVSGGDPAAASGAAAGIAAAFTAPFESVPPVEVPALPMIGDAP